MHTCILILALLIAGCSPAAIPQPVSPLAPRVYVPHVIGKTRPTATPRPTATASATPRPTPRPACYANAQAAAMAALVIGDSRQQRTGMRCNPALVKAAQQRAESLARLGYWAHCEPSGPCVNEVARRAGCKLPSYYGNVNNVESLVGGSPDAPISWAVLSASERHAPHVLGLVDFFREQHDIGIAYLARPGSKYGFYYVILVAVCEGPTSGE